MTIPTQGFQSVGKRGGRTLGNRALCSPAQMGLLCGELPAGFLGNCCLLTGVRPQTHWDLLSAEGLCVFIMVCTCVLVHTNMCTHMSICVCVCLSVYVYGHILACMRVHVCAHTSVRCVYVEWGFREASLFAKRLRAISSLSFSLFSPLHLPFSSFYSPYKRR